MDQQEPVDRDRSETFTWSRAVGLREQLPPEVVAAIDAVGIELAPHGDIETVVAALHARGLGFMHCIVGLMAIRGVPLSDAKWLVHGSAALAVDAADREAAWTAMYEEVMNAPE